MSVANRREFLQVAGAVAVTAAASHAVHAKGDDVIKVGLIGCGDRGGGAVKNCLAADPAVQVVAIGDVFEDRAKNVEKNLTGSREFAARVNIKDRVFHGLDAYRKVIDAGVDLVILASTPGFRPQHLEAAVRAGKHIFTEKPVAVDAPGIRRILGLVEESKKKGLAIAAGTQRRHQKSYQEIFKFISDGGIGDILGGRCSWNNNSIWFNSREKVEKRFGRPVSDVEYQIGNWYHFNWLCGDHIVEQHVHNLDVINWFTGQKPVRAAGMGGRMGGHKARPSGDAKDVGNIFDHFAIEFEYPRGVRIASYCRHYQGVGDVSELVVGTKGIIRTSDKMYYKFISPDGTVRDLYNAETERKQDKDPYVQEHIDLIRSIKAGSPINELQNVTESTMTAILGRMCAYTGEGLTWANALASKHDTMPHDLRLDASLPVEPLPVPGVTKFV